MTRRQLEHIIRASGVTADVRDVVVVESQAILGAFPDASGVFTESDKVDVFPRDDPARSIVIDGAIGEMSMFHRTFGYFAHGVDETTCILPEGWKSRLVRVENDNTMGVVGWCLEPHDLAVGKLFAGREKDLMFVEELLRLKVVSIAVLKDRLGTVNADQRLLDGANERLTRLKQSPSE